MTAERAILLVEGNPDDEALTLRAFRRDRISDPVVVARDGVEALDWLFREGAHAHRDSREPRLVILSLDLPKISGLEVLRRIRASDATRLLPVVVLTSSREESGLITAYELHANSCVRKPVDFERFIETVRDIGRYWLIRNESPAR
jgi:two-component system response regulator